MTTPTPPPTHASTSCIEIIAFGGTGSGRVLWHLFRGLLRRMCPAKARQRVPKTVKIGIGSRSLPPPDPAVCPPRIVVVPIIGTEPGWLNAISYLIALGRAVRAESTASDAAAGETAPPGIEPCSPAGPILPHPLLPRMPQGKSV